MKYFIHKFLHLQYRQLLADKDKKIDELEDGVVKKESLAVSVLKSEATGLRGDLREAKQRVRVILLLSNSVYCAQILSNVIEKNVWFPTYPCYTINLCEFLVSGRATEESTRAELLEADNPVQREGEGSRGGIQREAQNARERHRKPEGRTQSGKSNKHIM